MDPTVSGINEHDVKKNLRKSCVHCCSILHLMGLWLKHGTSSIESMNTVAPPWMSFSACLEKCVQMAEPPDIWGKPSYFSSSGSILIAVKQRKSRLSISRWKHFFVVCRFSFVCTTLWVLNVVIPPRVQKRTYVAASIMLLPLWISNVKLRNVTCLREE
jgi:hypothetical protein